MSKATRGGAPLALHPEGWAPGTGYAHGMAATGRFVVTAGQIGWDPVTCKMVSDDFAEQAAQTLRNVVAVLRAGGAGPEHLVRLTCTSPRATSTWRRVACSAPRTARSSARTIRRWRS